MAQIILDVKDSNIATVLNILENLKDGLIDSIESSNLSKQKVQYKPNSNTIINENEKPLGKYASKSLYKSRLK